MIYPFTPVLRVNKAWLADSERVVKDRLPGAFKRLVNIVPNLSDGIGQLRTGYQAFSLANGGIDINPGGGWTTEIPLAHPVQSPSDTDLFLLCQIDGSLNKRVMMHPHWIANGSTSPVLEQVRLNGSFRSGDGSGEFTLNADTKKIDFAAADRAAAGLSTTNDYYNGWLVYNETQSKYALVADYAVTDLGSGNFSAVVTFVQTVHGGSSLGFTAGNVLTWIANYHDNPYNATSFSSGFNPTYNDDKSNPPTSDSQNSIVRFSGGQGSTTGLRGSHITPRLTRTFFPSNSITFTMNKTYASERECKVPSNALASPSPVTTESGGGDTEILRPTSLLYADQWPFWTNSGSEERWEQVDGDEGGGVDADYINTVDGYTGDAEIGFLCSPPVETVDPGGNTVVTVRYKLEYDVSDFGNNVELEFGVFNSSGAIGTTTVVHIDSTGGYLSETVTVPNSDIDFDDFQIQIAVRNFTFPNGTQAFISDVFATVDTMVVTDFLTSGKTYWIGVAAIYDGFQIGKLNRIETVTDYGLTSGSWSNNYLPSGPGTLKVNFNVSLARLNKRITGYAIYLAVDEGEQTTRKALYQFVKHVSVTQADSFAAGWTYDTSTGNYTQSILITQTDVDTLGNTYTNDAGYLENATDIMYAYSTEAVVSGRRFLTNAYVTTEALVDRSFVFTNPTGHNPSINSDVIQPDIFSNEEGVFRLRVNPLVGTKVNALVATGVDEFLVLKDRGCITARIVMVGDTPDLVQHVISHDVGCSCVNSYAKDDAGVLYFAGYDDVYAYQNGQLQTLIERDDKNDWLYRYRSTVTRTQKESTTIFYLPELKSLMLLLGVVKAGTNYAQLQYLFHRGLWSEVMLNDDTDFNGTPNHSFRWVTQLRNGHVLVTSTDTTPAFYRMSWATADAGTTYALTYTDNGVGVSPFFDTGDLLLGDESTDVVLNKFVVNRTFTSQTLAGSLDLSVYNEDGAGYLKLALSSSDTRVTARFSPAIVRKGQSWRAMFNRASSGRERITAGQYQINSLEFFGKKLPRVRSTGK